MKQGTLQLLCTFCKLDSFEAEASALFEYYVIPDNRVYVLQNGQDQSEIFLTYNAERGSMEFYPHTMSVHRKKEFNVIYSINALNELVRLENGGIASREFQLDWKKYSNSLITSREGKVKITPTILMKIFRV